VPVVTLGVLGTGWGVAGVLLLRAAGAVHATAHGGGHGGGHEPLGGADRAGYPSGAAAQPGAGRGGLGAAPAGGLLPRACARRLRGDWRADQQ
jgi:hypothetical protein